MSIGCKIVKDFQRPAPELVTRFKDMPVANIDDNMGRIAAVDAAIEPIGYKGQLLGTAFTVRVPQGDNLMFHAAMDLAKPGDVIVIDAGGFTDRAIFGELMATYCKARGIKGIVCDGAIRDRGGLAAMEDFHVYARSATPNGPYKNGPGEINFPVSLGGQVICPGDILVGDGDSILVIKPEDAEALAKAAAAVKVKEEGQIRDIKAGKGFPRPFVDQILEQIGVEYVD